VSKNRYNRSQLLHPWIQIIQRWTILVLKVFWKFVSVAECSNFFGKKLPKYLFFKYFGAVVPILRIALHKRPTIHVAHIAFPVGSQQIESTNLLSKLLYYPVANELLIRSQDDRVPKLFAFLVSLDDAI